jgi:hypothetical protein
MLQSEAGYIDARPKTARSMKTSCDARPEHTNGSVSTIPGQVGVFRSTPMTGNVDLVQVFQPRANSSRSAVAWANFAIWPLQARIADERYRMGLVV